MSDRSRLLIPGAYAAVIFPFVWFLPSHWGSWAAGFVFFALLTAAEVVAICLIGHFEPVDVEDRR